MKKYALFISFFMTGWFHNCFAQDSSRTKNMLIFKAGMNVNFVSSANGYSTTIKHNVGLHSAIGIVARANKRFGVQLLVSYDLKRYKESVANLYYEPLSSCNAGFHEIGISILPFYKINKIKMLVLAGPRFTPYNKLYYTGEKKFSDASLPYIMRGQTNYEYWLNKMKRYTWLVVEVDKELFSSRKQIFSAIARYERSILQNEATKHITLQSITVGTAVRF